MSANTGDGSAALSAALTSPWGIAIDPSGNTLYVADNAVSKIRIVYQVASMSLSLPATTALAPPSYGLIYTVAGGGSQTNLPAIATSYSL